MNDRELLTQALEALERGETALRYAAITALRERLAREEREPVAWELRKGKTDRVLLEITNDPKRAHDWKCSLEEVVPLYTAPQPAVRDWQGLTEEEIEKEGGRDYDLRWFARAIEAKLNEKNQ